MRIQGQYQDAAGVGVGVYEDESSGAERCLRLDKKFEPNPELNGRYWYQFELFKEVHDALQLPFNKLAKMP